MSMMITRRSAVFGAASTLALAREAAAQDKIVLKMGTLGSVEYFYYKGAGAWRRNRPPRAQAHRDPGVPQPAAR